MDINSIMENNSDLDYEFDEESSEQGTVTESNERAVEMDADFTVSLGGGGIFEPIKWTFPDTLRCLFPKCPPFESRYETMTHFKRSHAQIATICIPCNKVLLATSMQRHQLTKTHVNIIQLTQSSQAQFTDEPKSPIEEAKERLIKNPQINFQPQSISEETKKQPKQDQMKQRQLKIQINETKHNGKTHKKHGTDTLVDTKPKKHNSTPSAISSRDEDVFEFIMADRNDRKIWRFPLTSCCPIHHCREKVFPNRNDALIHFRSKHAGNAIWCGHCKIIISAQKLKENVHQHFKVHHANIQLPSNWTTKLPKLRCSDCGKEYANITNLRKHIETDHKPRVFKCTENGCSFQTRRAEKIKHHQYKYHILTKKPNRLKYMDEMYMKKTQPKSSKSMNSELKKMVKSKPMPMKSNESFSRMTNGTNTHSKQHKPQMPHTTGHKPEMPHTTGQHKKVIENPLIIRRSKKQYAFDADTCSRQLARSTENYVCVNCCLKFDSQTTLQNHLHSKHNTRLRMQKCKLCNESIRSKKLNAHYYWQHNRFINKCPFCEQAFIETETFKRHITNEIYLRNKMPHSKENDMNAMNSNTKKRKRTPPSATITSATMHKSLDMPSLYSEDESHIMPHVTPSTSKIPNTTNTARMKRKSMDMPLISSDDESHIEQSYITPKKSKKDEKLNSTDLQSGTIKLTPDIRVDAKVVDCVVSIQRLSQKQIELLTQDQGETQTEQNHMLPVQQNHEQSKSKRKSIEQLVKAEQSQIESKQPIKTEQQLKLKSQPEDKRALFYEMFGDYSDDDLEDSHTIEPDSKNVSLEEDSLHGQMEHNDDDNNVTALVTTETSRKDNGYSNNCSPTEMDTTGRSYDLILKSPNRQGFTSASEDESFVTVKDLI